MIKLVLIVNLLFYILPLETMGQDINTLMKDAQQLEARFNDKEALNKYLEIYKYQQNNIVVLCRISELYALVGRREQSKDGQADFYKKAKAFAQHALRVNSNSSEANFVMALAMGRIALISSGEDKINAVKEIKSFAEKSIQLDPNYFKPYHILGKWHFEVSELSQFERWLLKVAYGSLPKSSLDTSIKFYEKSRQLNPGFLLNYLELARAYKRKDQENKSIELLTTMLKLPPSSSNDAHIKSEGKKLLEDLR